jgi:hypothetical protein
MLQKLSLAAGLVLACIPSAMADGATEAWRLGGLKSPESVIFDKANNRLIVGNMVTFGPDGGADGYLSIVSPDGKLVTEQWAKGLSDPKGMAIVGDSLFVADSTGLVEIKLADGSVVATLALEGAQFPNDVTTDGTSVYVSDMMGSAIYKVTGGVVEKWLSDGSMGTGMKPDFSFETRGGLQAVDLASKAITQIAMDTAYTDGVAKLGDKLIYDDNPAGAVLAFADGKVSPLSTLSPGSADLWAEGDMIYVPLTQTGELVALKVE